MKVVELEEEGMATAELSGTRRRISTSLLEEVRVGDWVIVHAGFAIQVLDEREAEETLSGIREILEEES